MRKCRIVFTVEAVVEDSREVRSPDAVWMATAAMRESCESAARMLSLSGVSLAKLDAQIEYKGEIVEDGHVVNTL